MSETPPGGGATSGTGDTTPVPATASDTSEATPVAAPTATTPSATSVMGEIKSADERKAALARTITNQVAAGWRVESQSDYQAVLLKGRHVRHVLHLVLTILTVGLWAIVWITMWAIYHERRQIAEVDEYGNVRMNQV